MAAPGFLRIPRRLRRFYVFLGPVSESYPRARGELAWKGSS